MYTTYISAKELKDNLGKDNWVIIDCRFSLANTEAGQTAFNEAHIPGAVYAHLDNDLSGPIIPGETSRHPLPTIEDFVKKCRSWGIENSSQVVLYDNNGGMIASRLWWMLNWVGHNRVAVLDGAWDAWLAADMPVSNEKPEVQKSEFRASLNTELLVEVEEVESIRQDASFVLIDSRANKRYRGEVEPLDPIAGHIPGAVNAPNSEVIGAEAKVLDKEALKAHFDPIIEEKSMEKVVFYCGSGVSACRNILAMQHAGYGMAKLYAGSWSEWITDPERPIGTIIDS